MVLSSGNSLNRGTNVSWFTVSQGEAFLDNRVKSIHELSVESITQCSKAISAIIVGSSNL